MKWKRKFEVASEASAQNELDRNCSAHPGEFATTLHDVNTLGQTKPHKMSSLALFVCSLQVHEQCFRA